MSVIEIKNSSFAYKDKGTENERKVLSIDELAINSGEITFIVGVSGAGKSTMLETIGLMNDTFPSDMNQGMSIKFNVYNSATGEIEARDITNPNIWDETTENVAIREKIRKDNYSFIFQNTNLMPNFSALENVCITDMLNGHSFEEAYLKALLIFRTLGLGDLDLDISPQNVSGGQRQRIAFARALIPEYRVLFGDEPTGNLDRKTSLEVMGILHNYIKSTQSEEIKTGTVIVSHDLDLAVKYADRIIVITKIDGKGTIHPEHIFVNTDDDDLIHKEYDFKSSVRHAFDMENTVDNIIALRQEIMNELNEQRVNSKGNYQSRKYITVNDYLEAFLSEIKNPAICKGIFNEQFIIYLENLLKDEKKVSAPVVKEAVNKNTEQHKGACHNWTTPYGDNHHDKYTRREVLKKIEKLLAVDKDYTDEQRAAALREKIKDAEFVESKKGFKDVLYRFFLWLTRRIPDKTGLYPEFTKLFYEKESIELLGYHSRLRNFWTVFIIMLVTFLAIGFANGSLIYLGDKMKDPFVKSMNVAVQHDRQSDVDLLIETLNNDTVALQTYGVNKATGFTLFPLEFRKNNGKLTMLTGRTMNEDDPILKELLKGSNVITGETKGFRSYNDDGIIISEKMLLDLGLNADTKFIPVHVMESEDVSADIPIPVRAVLRRLPGDLDDEISFLITGFLHANLVLPITETNIPYSPDNTKSLEIYLDSQDTLVAENMMETVKTYLNDNNSRVSIDGANFRVRQPRLLKYKVDSSAYVPGYSMNIAFMGRKPSYNQIAMLFDDLVQITSLKELPVTMKYTVDHYTQEQVARADRRLDRLTIHFDKLNHIQSFEDEYIKPKYPYINLDMAKIESLKNYNYITKLTMGLSIILVILSVYSIASFLSNVFENHLNKIKMNIGTLMAFGTGGLKLIYRRLMMVYLFIPLTFSLIIASLLGYLGLIRLIMSCLIRDLDKGLFFNLWSFGNPPATMPLIITILAVFSIVLVTLQRYKKIIHSLLQKTPGDLIFGRDS